MEKKEIEDIKMDIEDLKIDIEFIKKNQEKEKIVSNYINFFLLGMGIGVVVISLAYALN